MSVMWPLFMDELSHALPRIDAALDALDLDDADATARSRLAQEVAKLRSAMRVLEAPNLEVLLNPLRDAAANIAVRRSALGHLHSLVQMDSFAAASAFVATSLQAQASAPTVQPSTPAMPIVETAAPARRRNPAIEASLEALFATEVAERSEAITRQLLILEADPTQIEPIRPLLRALHSIKGAARAVGVDTMVAVAHALEDRLSARTKGLPLDGEFIDLALRGNDAMRARADHSGAQTDALDATLNALMAELAGAAEAAPIPIAHSAAGTDDVLNDAPEHLHDEDPILRVRASQITQLINLASSISIDGNHLERFAAKQTQLRRQLSGVRWQLDEFFQRHGTQLQDRAIAAELGTVRVQLDLARATLNSSSDDFSSFTRSTQQLHARLLNTATSTRMRPFAELAAGYPRLVRDLARQLGKQVRLDISGERVDVDRDVLSALDMPLTHLLRNALDHGLETPDARLFAGKAAVGVLKLSASLRAGSLTLDLSDDGAGVDPERVRKRLIEVGHLHPDAAAKLDLNALHEALFAAGFSTRDAVTETSGRGVGLDAVRQMVRDLGGTTRLDSRLGFGTRFDIQVPISRVILRALLIEVSGELCAFALHRISRVLRVSADELMHDGGVHYLSVDGRSIGLIALSEQLEFGRFELAQKTEDRPVSIVVFEHFGRRIGCVVDRILGEADLATHTLDPRLGRTTDVAAVALTAEGDGVIVLDVDDLMRSVFDPAQRSVARSGNTSRQDAASKRVLVVDDSISVRELERQLLSAAGFDVEVAVDGEDAWQKLQLNTFDLMVTDIDMPRLDGLALTRSVRLDARLHSLPIIIVSYRNSPEDHARGMEARADRYLTKSDFGDERFLGAVIDLIGAPGE
jgi:two-component system, chemotaxis family, sensor histidine kinase and response regulator WspE